MRTRSNCFTVLDVECIDETLVASLTDVIDDARDIATQLGARPYRVTLVWVQWSGPKRGQGVATRREEMLLPTPNVIELNSMQTQQNPIGGEPVGSMRVKEISPFYTEDYLVGNLPDGTPKPANMEFYWEVEIRRSTGPGQRRRFIPKATPQKLSEDGTWSVILLKVSADPARDGRVA